MTFRIWLDEKQIGQMNKLNRMMMFVYVSQVADAPRWKWPQNGKFIVKSFIIIYLMKAQINLVSISGRLNFL